MTILVIWGNTSNHTQVKSWRNATNVIMPRRCNRIWSESMTRPLTSLPSHSINSPTDRGNCKEWSWVIKTFFLKTLSKVLEPHHHQTPPSLPIDISSLQNQTFAVADPSFRVIQLYSLFKSWLVHLTTLCFPVLLLHFHIQFTLSPSLHLLPRHQLWKSESML